MKIFTLLLVIVSLVIGGSFVLAQGAPPQVDVALQDLNTQLGTELTLDELDNWTWAEQVYGDASLGCPQPDQVYAQETTRGYQFIFEYQGVTYDYRVATDGSFFILCSATGTQTPDTTEPVTPSVVTPTLPAATPSTNTCLMVGRLVIGAVGRVTAGLPSNLRAEAGIDAADVGDAQGGETFTVLAGPTCVADTNWWQVQTETLTGWIAEGQNGLYFVEPIPQPLPEVNALTPISDENVASVTELSQIQGNLAGEMAWAEDTLAVVYSNPIQPGIWLYDVTALDTALPTLLETQAFPTALEFSPDGLILAVGYENGTVEFFTAAANESIFSTQAHNGAVRDLRFNAEGTVLTSIGEDNTVKFWGVSADG